MDIKPRVKANVVILDLYSSIDINSANMIEIVGQCLRDGYLDILCNFEEVESIDYMGISAIVLAYKEVMNNNGRMKFANIPAHLRSLFSVTGLDRAIEIYATEDLAMNSFKEDKIIENIKKMQLRRRFKRLPVDIKIDLRDKSNKEAVCYKADILNLSAIGAYIYGCDKFKLGDELNIKLKLPHKNVELELQAKVVWICDRQVQQQISPGIGVEFHKISSQDQAKIIEFIDRNLSFSSTED
ncbi:MAG: PilZ domain-containing protein [Candidatus Omnitrophica bacterium]|nr:PilZ domain-containing protein [Candidatus Omnitrophota bacterium]